MTVLGTGRWASFHAWYQAVVLKNAVTVWGREGGSIVDLERTRKNEYVTLPTSVKFTSDLGGAIGFAEYIIIAISAQAMPEFSRQVAQVEPRGKTFVLAMKGIIDATGERLSEVLGRALNHPGNNKIVVWVGPGHPQEFISGQPNVNLIDGDDRGAVKAVIGAFGSSLLRLYEGEDLIGAEVGAAAKNVLGIIAGMLDGSGWSSLKGGLMARGVYEVAKLIVAMGGRQLTAYGISHLGDFEATLFSKMSRNRNFGESLVLGGHAPKPPLPEGVATSKALMLLAGRYKVEMPICRACFEIVHNGKDMKKCMTEMFERANAREFMF